ncbi:uncharacterized protein MONBRDRAFT_31000 [Monosiga brevicollis MX1]|uniref:RING-type domain-containing protein n=1 Tax=Monosiga brevicollis TaxID=81824 RepID=A9UQN3_MONBE|nr:uncharacterized protein MONBRDRAFT_31000 [Monosiga brevicollis MX1]EDQ92629.1 predicted protein [Monosiga brevicollis MX1]|eukprot:XP_001742391.1 hypothetical protein [Monosiga brevicollis MX1]
MAWRQVFAARGLGVGWRSNIQTRGTKLQLLEFRPTPESAKALENDADWAQFQASPEPVWTRIVVPHLDKEGWCLLHPTACTTSDLELNGAAFSESPANRRTPWTVTPLPTPSAASVAPTPSLDSADVDLDVNGLNLGTTPSNDAHLEPPSVASHQSVDDGLPAVPVADSKTPEEASVNVDDVFAPQQGPAGLDTNFLQATADLVEQSPAPATPSHHTSTEPTPRFRHPKPDRAPHFQPEAIAPNDALAQRVDELLLHDQAPASTILAQAVHGLDSERFVMLVLFWAKHLLARDLIQQVPRPTPWLQRLAYEATRLPQEFLRTTVLDQLFQIDERHMSVSLEDRAIRRVRRVLTQSQPLQLLATRVVETVSASADEDLEPEELQAAARTLRIALTFNINTPAECARIVRALQSSNPALLLPATKRDLALLGPAAFCSLSAHDVLLQASHVDVAARSYGHRSFAGDAALWLFPHLRPAFIKANPKSLVGVAMSLAMASQLPASTAQAMRQLLSQLDNEVFAELSNHEVALLMWALGVHADQIQPLSADVVHSVCDRVTKNIKTMWRNDLAHLLWSFERLNVMAEMGTQLHNQINVLASQPAGVRNAAVLVTSFCPLHVISRQRVSGYAEALGRVTGRVRGSPANTEGLKRFLTQVDTARKVRRLEYLQKRQGEEAVAQGGKPPRTKLEEIVLERNAVLTLMGNNIDKSSASDETKSKLLSMLSTAWRASWHECCFDEGKAFLDRGTTIMRQAMEIPELRAYSAQWQAALQQFVKNRGRILNNEVLEGGPRPSFKIFSKRVFSEGVRLGFQRAGLERQRYLMASATKPQMVQVLHLMDGPKPSSGAKKEHLVTAMLENYSSNLLEPEILFQSLRHGTPQEYLLEVAAALSSEQPGHEDMDSAASSSKSFEEEDDDDEEDILDLLDDLDSLDNQSARMWYYLFQSCTDEHESPICLALPSAPVEDQAAAEPVSPNSPTSPTEDKFQCHICFSQAIDHRSCPSCTSIYCGACLNRWYSSTNNPSCPNCRRPHSYGMFTHDTEVQALLDLQPATCSFCRTSCPLGELRAHESTCLDEVVSCPYKGCAHQAARRNLDMHTVVCPMAPHMSMDQVVDAVMRRSAQGCDAMQASMFSLLANQVRALSQAAESDAENEDTLIHHVTTRDTLPGLAIRYDCNVEDITRLNRIFTNVALYGRQTIIVPKPKNFQPKMEENVSLEVLVALRKKQLTRKLAFHHQLSHEEALSYLHLTKFNYELSEVLVAEDELWTQQHRSEQPKSFDAFMARLERGAGFCGFCRKNLSDKRAHCSHCGTIVCHSCSPTTLKSIEKRYFGVTNPSTQMDQVNVCGGCHQELLSEPGSYDQNHAVKLSGAQGSQGFEF